MGKKWVLAFIWGLGTTSYLANILSKAATGRLDLVEDLPALVLLLSIGGVGTLIVNRHPHNPVGWAYLGVVGYFSVEAIVESLIILYLDGYLEVGDRIATLIPFADAYGGILEVAVWSGLLIFIPILYFPNGRLPSQRYRYVLWGFVIALALWLLGSLFNPELTTGRFQDFRNPLANPTIGQIARTAEVVFIFALVIPPLSLIARFRRASAVERQQIKWPLLSAIILGAGIGWTILASAITGANMDEPGANEPLINIGLALEVIGVISLPITIGIAILRYRLYDIDIIIRRTLVYTALTALLGAVYFGSIIVLQEVFRRLTGQDSPLAIVLSTLLMAALFSPLRGRIQAFIDRRFYRRKYDAAQALTRFAETARDEVDLDDLVGELLKMVQETMQPEHVSLLLKRQGETGQLEQWGETGPPKA